MQDDKKRLKLAEESLSPEEEHKIEVRVDKMMKFDAPEEADTSDESDDAAAAEKSEEAEAQPDEAGEAATDDLAKPTPEPETESQLATASQEDDELARLAADPILSDKPAEPVEEPVDELAAKETEAKLDKQDDEVTAAFTPPKKAKGHRLRRFFASWWHNKKARWATLVVVLLLLVGAGVWSPSRAWALNLVGMRAAATVTVLDDTTQLPLKNVTVGIGSARSTTDAAGQATIKNAKLGSQTLSVQKVAFAATTKKVTIGLGTNKLGSVALQPAGDQYRLNVIDYVTGKPIVSAQAASGQATAVADKKGLITLTANAGNNKITINITADGYRATTIKVPSGTSSVTTVQLIIDRQEVFFSNQSGKYDLYKIDLDSQNKKVLLAATGKETSELALLPHPTADEVAIVNTRDGNRDSGGYLLQTLTLINTTTGAPTSVDHSERIIPIDWVGDRLVYVMIKAGASAANPSRYQLMSYDYRTNQRLELDHANAFNDIVSTAGSLYYATSNQYNGGTSQFVRINADSTNKQVLQNGEVWNILRKDYTMFYLNTGSDNYTYKLGDNKPTATKDAYTSASRLYIDSPDSKHALWVDQRDGKPTLLVYDVSKQTDTVLTQQEGLTYPVRWLSNDTVVYRVKSDKETADYVTALGTNTAKKITDVTNATGRSLWYFY